MCLYIFYIKSVIFLISFETYTRWSLSFAPESCCVFWYIFIDDNITQAVDWCFSDNIRSYLFENWISYPGFVKDWNKDFLEALICDHIFQQIILSLFSFKWIQLVRSYVGTFYFELNEICGENIQQPCIKMR